MHYARINLGRCIIFSNSSPIFEIGSILLETLQFGFVLGLISSIFEFLIQKENFSKLKAEMKKQFQLSNFSYLFIFCNGGFS